MISKDSSSAGTGAGAARARETGSVIGLTVKDRYLIEREIGTGGFGQVYLARDLELLSKPVVIKLLREESLTNDWVQTKFRHEIEALTRIDHPGVVGVLATGSMPDGNPFIVMEYVEGVSLRSIMEEFPDGLEFERATEIVHQIGYALNAAHEKGVVHRDLKPENIMVRNLGGEEEQVKLIDFGIAKVKESRLAPSTVMAETAGTVVYMAPEQLNGLPVSGATDIYSLGTITYELLTGRRPFNPATIFQLSDIQRNGVKIKPSDLRRFVPPAVDEVILRALSYDPETRFATASKFADALAEAMLEGTVSQSRQPRGVAKTVQLQKIVVPTRPSRRNYWLIGGALALLVAVIGISLTLWSFTRPTPTSSSKDVVASPTATNPTTSTPVTNRSIDYYLMVQKYLPDGTAFQKPFKSTGNEVLGDGWKFTVHTSSAQEGYLYLLNEGPIAGRVTFVLLHPTPKTNNGSALIKSGQAFEAGPYQLDTNQGKEKFWMVWSASPVPELEAVKSVVNPKERGIVSDQAQIDAINKFLLSGQLSKSDLEIDKPNYTVRLRSKSDSIVNLMELEHR